MLSVQCEGGMCCVEFRCDDDWQPTLEKLIGKTIELKEEMSDDSVTAHLFPVRCRQR